MPRSATIASLTELLDTFYAALFSRGDGAIATSVTMTAAYSYRVAPDLPRTVLPIAMVPPTKVDRVTVDASISCALKRPVPVQIDRDAPAPDQPDLERGLALPPLYIGCVADPEANAGHAGIEIAERTNVRCEQVERSAEVAVATALESRILIDRAEIEPEIHEDIEVAVHVRPQNHRAEVGSNAACKAVVVEHAASHLTLVERDVEQWPAKPHGAADLLPVTVRRADRRADRVVACAGGTALAGLELRSRARSGGQLVCFERAAVPDAAARE